MEERERERERIAKSSLGVFGFLLPLGLLSLEQQFLLPPQRNNGTGSVLTPKKAMRKIVPTTIILNFRNFRFSALLFNDEVVHAHDVETIG